MQERVILVDENDNQTGTEEKIAAHEKALLHRAFSIFVFNNKGELLLQKRAGTKYHCGGLWTNTVCSHPREGESLNHAAHRRLGEEMGFDCEVLEIFEFVYKKKFDNGLSEHEYDHVFIGKFDGQPIPNPVEVEDIKWMSINEIKEDIEKNPENYTYWFKIAIKKIKNK